MAPRSYYVHYRECVAFGWTIERIYEYLLVDEIGWQVRYVRLSTSFIMRRGRQICAEVVCTHMHLSRGLSWLTSLISRPRLGRQLLALSSCRTQSFSFGGSGRVKKAWPREAVLEHNAFVP